MSSAKRRPFCLGLNVLTHPSLDQNSGEPAENTFKSIFLNENILILAKFLLNIILRNISEVGNIVAADILVQCVSRASAAMVSFLSAI